MQASRKQTCLLFYSFSVEKRQKRCPCFQRRLKEIAPDPAVEMEHLRWAAAHKSGCRGIKWEGKDGAEQDEKEEDQQRRNVFLDLVFIEGLFAGNAWGVFEKSFFDYRDSKLSEVTQKYLT